MTYARNKALGAYGERVAAEFVEAEGMAVLARNWVCSHGEIDLVLRDGDTLVIAEVKTRSNANYGPPQAAVTAQKAARLRRLAAYWLQIHQVQPAGVRIDVISVLIPEVGAPVVERISGIA